MDVQLIYLHDQQLINNKQRLFLYSTVSIRHHQGLPQKLFFNDHQISKPEVFPPTSSSRMYPMIFRRFQRSKQIEYSKGKW